MQKLEAAFQREFGKWVQHRWMGGTFAYELKRTLTNSLPMSAIKEHQIIALQQSTTAFHYKIPDAGFAQSPFDGFFMRANASYIGIAFGKKLEDFYLISIHHVAKWKSDGKRSITEDMAKRHGLYFELR